MSVAYVYTVQQSSIRDKNLVSLFCIFFISCAMYTRFSVICGVLVDVANTAVCLAVVDSHF